MCFKATPTKDDSLHASKTGFFKRKTLHKQIKAKTDTWRLNYVQRFVSSNSSNSDRTRRIVVVVANHKIVRSSGDCNRQKQTNSSSCEISESDSSERTRRTLQRSSSLNKIKTRTVNSLFKGAGKELRRATSNIVGAVSDRILIQRKGAKKEKDAERIQLMAAQEQARLSNVESPQGRSPLLRRTPAEIKAAYGYTTDLSSAAGLASRRLMERQEKMSALQRRTGELEAEASNFASLTQELAKKMEKRKWYDF